MTFQEKLYQLRKEKGYSQQQLAWELGVTRQAIFRWELGEVVPDTANVLAMCRVFGVSAEELLCWDTLLAVLAIFLPRVLSGIPGNWGTLIGLIPGALVIGWPIRALLAGHYWVEPPGRRAAGA